MSELISDVSLVRDASPLSQKYDQLLQRFAVLSLPLEATIELVYLAPGDSPELESQLSAMADSHLIRFDQLDRLQVSRQAFEWSLFRDLVLPSLVGTN